MSGSKINLNKEIISLFSGQASIVTTPKLYIQLTGSHSLATVLNQCVFWSNKSELKDGWFYKKYTEWYEEIHIPERTLRRCFERLEILGWITTKVKKVKGVNIKHIHPNMDRIIESISDMLSTDSPIRPLCPPGSINDQNSCTKIAPTGHIGRSETATLSDSSIYTEENKQMSVGDSSNPSSHKDFKIEKNKKELAERKALEAPEIKSLFDTKFAGIDVTIEKLFADCQEHYEQKSLWATRDKFLKWVKNENIDNYKKLNENKKPLNFDPTRPTVLDFQEYNARVKGYEWVGDWIKKQKAN